MRSIALLWLVGCSADPDTDTDGATDGDTDTDPTAARCNDPGPDAQVVAKVEPVSFEFEGFPVLYFVPPNPKGVIFYFQGGENLSELVANEQVAMLWNQMVDAGFGVVGTQRTSPGDTTWQWDVPVDRNDDALRLDRLRDHLVDTTGLEADTPVVTTGFSDGSGMATNFAKMADEELGWPIAAATAHNSFFGDVPKHPVMFLVSTMDEVAGTNWIPNMIDDLKAADVPYERIDYLERDVAPDRLVRDEAWDLAKGQECMDDLVEYGLIDASGKRLVSDERMVDALMAWSAATDLQGAAICEARVRVLWATHRYSAFSAKEECEFLLGAVEGTLGSNR